MPTCKPNFKTQNGTACLFWGFKWKLYYFVIVAVLLYGDQLDDPTRSEIPMIMGTFGQQKAKYLHTTPHEYLETWVLVRHNLWRSCKFNLQRRKNKKDHLGDKANGTFSLYVLAGTCRDDSSAGSEEVLCCLLKASVQQIRGLFIHHHVTSGFFD